MQEKIKEVCTNILVYSEVTVMKERVETKEMFQVFNIFITQKRVFK